MYNLPYIFKQEKEWKESKKSQSILCIHPSQTTPTKSLVFSLSLNSTNLKKRRKNLLVSLVGILFFSQVSNSSKEKKWAWWSYYTTKRRSTYMHACVFACLSCLLINFLLVSVEKIVECLSRELRERMRVCKLCPFL